MNRNRIRALVASATSLGILALVSGSISAPQDDPGVTANATKTKAAETFRIDTTHSMALFRVQHFNAGAFWGRFNGVSGEIEHDEASAGGLKFNVTIDIESIDTANDQLDNHSRFGLRRFELSAWRISHPKT